MTPPLRVAVVGVGSHGRHHARILSELGCAAPPAARLAGVVDINRGRADAVAAELGTRPYYDAVHVMGEVDAVVIAVPTERHEELAVSFLERGIGVLVEKPCARSTAEVDRMLAAAGRTGAMLAVGHTERHNPAVAAGRAYVHDPRFVEVHRLGTFPERSLDVDVVFDVMIHDLDVLLALVGSEVSAIDAVGVPVLSDKHDIANVRLRFESGCIANLTASRISRDRVRKIRFFQPGSYVSIDYGRQELEVWTLVPQAAGRPAIEGGKVAVARGEPLKREIEDFLDAVTRGRPPLVTGVDARRAVALAEQISLRMAEVSV